MVEGKDLVVLKRNTPISNVPEISFGSMPNDGGNFLFTDEEKKDFLKVESNAKKFVKPLYSNKEFLNGKRRWCLWLKDAEPKELRELKEVMKRIEAVKKLRMESDRDATKKLAEHSQLFGEIRQPNSRYIFIPLTSSENRKYIPFGFFEKSDIANNTASLIPKANQYHFGILQSTMHMAWVRNVCGRLESRFRYSNEIVYNNFPWPEKLKDKSKQSIEEAAQHVLDVRKEFQVPSPSFSRRGLEVQANQHIENSGEVTSLADLYDSRAMPLKLSKAHQELDKAVDAAYRSKPFECEAKRMEFLFELYEKYTADLFMKGKGKKKE